MRICRLLSLLALLLAGLPANAAAAPILLFQNDFESPTGIVIPSGCCGDASQQSVNSLYGTAFQQTFTVETLAVNGPQNVYTDPSGQGGNYVLGLLQSVQNDLLSLTFDTQGLDFLNLKWDIAAVGIDQFAGLPSTPTFLTGASAYTLTLYDTPGGLFNINTLGAYSVLDTAGVAGTAPSPDGLTFNWSTQVVALNSSASTDGRVTLLIDLVGGGYGAFDNLTIASSDTEGELPSPVPEPASLLLMGAGLSGIAALVRRRR